MRISDWSSDVCSSDLAVSASAAPWVRPRKRSTASSSACTPSDTRLTPASRKPSSLDASTEVGLASRVTSRSLATRKDLRSEEHTSELQSLMRISYAVFCLKKKNNQIIQATYIINIRNNSTHTTTTY